MLHVSGNNIKQRSKAAQNSERGERRTVKALLFGLLFVALTAVSQLNGFSLLHDLLRYRMPFVSHLRRQS